MSAVQPTQAVRDEFVANKLAMALATFRKADNARFTALLRYMPRLLVQPNETSEYWHLNQICVLHRPHVETLNSGSLAMVIAHELAHAKISHKIGEGFFLRPTRMRIEKAAIKSELRFAARLGEVGYGIDGAVAELRQKLARLTEKG